MRRFRMSLCVPLIVLGLVTGANAIIINGTDVGSVDDLIAVTNLSESSFATEQNWVKSVLGNDAFVLKPFDTQENDWLTGKIDQVNYGALALGDEAEYFYLKVGAGNNDPPFTHFLFKNNADLAWAAISLTFVYNGTSYAIKNVGKVSHVGVVNPVPEPTAILLFGAGLLAIAGASRRIKK